MLCIEIPDGDARAVHQAQTFSELCAYDVILISRYRNSGKNADDCYNDHEFDKSKARITFHDGFSINIKPAIAGFIFYT